jgi:fatty acid desaturase
MTAVPGLDLDAFAADLEAVRKDIAADRGASDLRHFRKLTRWSQACTALGWATAWIAPNPLSILALSLGNVSRWTILGHHLCHRGLDGIDGVPPTWHSKRFGRGWRRPLQWLDWMPADSWHEEHDVLHHYKLGEQGDPDVAEENLAWLRGPRVPMWFRYAFVWGAALIWKPTYYAANTINARHSEAEIKRGERTERMNLFDRRAWLPWHPRGRDLWPSSSPTCTASWWWCPTTPGPICTASASRPAPGPSSCCARCWAPPTSAPAGTATTSCTAG